MLAGAWVLGWLFWAMMKGSNYQSKIKMLSNELGIFKEKSVELEENLAKASYEAEKSKSELDSLQKKHSEMELGVYALKEQLEAAKREGSGEDSSNWEKRVAKLGDELLSTKQARDQFKAQYDEIKAAYDALKAES